VLVASPGTVARVKADAMAGTDNAGLSGQADPAGRAGGGTEPMWGDAM